MTREIRTHIIPKVNTFANTKGQRDFDLEAICTFAALGFFLDKDTYWKNKVVLPPASINILDQAGNLENSNPWFEWYYKPRSISFEMALTEFSELFESIINDQVKNLRVILPLSGGLDSRTQAAALNFLNKDVASYSYRFKNGYNESKIGKQIANYCNFSFEEFVISEGYLWNSIDELAQLNNCMSDFTTPRQMAMSNEYTHLGNVFSLGHWGDVLFDNMNLPELSHDQQVEVLTKKLVKGAGSQLANTLWESWGLSGNFNTYLKNRISQLLEKINIDNTNAKLRAFKSLYWAPRWTAVNLTIFSQSKPVTLPYFDDRMCKFICTIPEEYLSNRQLQIAYIKMRSPKLANLVWQENKPFNLNNYHLNKTPYNLPTRVINKIRRSFNQLISGKEIQRNWELQFLGEENDEKLKTFLFENNLQSWIPESVIKEYYKHFKGKKQVQYAHVINMLLVLSYFNASINSERNG